MKIGMLEWNEELIMHSVEAELLKLGHEVKKFRIDSGSGTEIIEQIKIYKCDFWLTHCYYVFDLWKRGREIENHFESQKIAVLTWYWENPICSGSFNWLKRFQEKEIPKNILFMAVDPEHVELLRNQNLNSELLPMAVSDELFKYKCPEEEKSKWNFDTAFVGMPCNQMQIEVDSPSEMLDAYINLFFLELFDRMKHHSKEELEDASKVSLVVQRLGFPIQLFFSKMYGKPDAYLQAKMALFQTGKLFLSSSWQSCFAELSGRIDFIYSWYQLHSYIFGLTGEQIRVFGGSAWKEYLLAGYPYETPKLSEADLLACFSQAKIQFCHTKWQFRHALHERPLKILAVGGFPLTDFRSETLRLLGEDAIATYSSLDEARDKIKFYLKNESARMTMAKIGHEKTFTEHRMSVRIHSLLKLASDFI